jgi:hypothetical protein
MPALRKHYGPFTPKMGGKSSQESPKGVIDPGWG